MEHTDHNVVTKREFEALSEFRFQLRCFERFSEDAVQTHGITPLHYLLLLHIKGYPGRSLATVNELSMRLQVDSQCLAHLLDHCEKNGFVQSHPADGDQRQVEIQLLEKGESVLAQLAALHRAELRGLNGVFPIPLINF